MSQKITTKLSWLKVLLLEDQPEDAFLIEREVKKVVNDLDMQVTKNKDIFEEQVSEFAPHIILADYSLPQYSGLHALQYVIANATALPFVFVTNILQDEELAAETILNGANGFVLKNNLSKLGPLIYSLMTVPQHLTAFEIPSRLWICKYNQDLAAWQMNNQGATACESLNPLIAEAQEMYEDAQKMLAAVRSRLAQARP